MFITNSFKGLSHKYSNIVIGLGNFDGVHIGHQQLITQVVKTAKEINGTPVIFTFYPHPLAILNPKEDPIKLLSQEDKEYIIGKLGVKVLITVPFDMNFAKLTPEKFVEEVIFKELSASVVVVGYNYTFGSCGSGTPETLKKYSKEFKYQIKVISPVTIEGNAVSSSYIRQMITEGNVELASQYLGYSHLISGIVVTGDRRGNTIGFPTANLVLNEKLVAPANGVYSTYVIVHDKTYLGVTNIGTKPTFNSEEVKRNLEVHILDFDEDIYGEQISVHFIRRLRNEKRFNSLTELMEQIQQDVKKTSLTCKINTNPVSNII